jgi:hypothetical protein
MNSNAAMRRMVAGHAIEFECWDKAPGRTWLHEVESCISLASSVSDRCLAALINPMSPRS